jgi:hypothetical protein
MCTWQSGSLGGAQEEEEEEEGGGGGVTFTPTTTAHYYHHHHSHHHPSPPSPLSTAHINHDHHATALHMLHCRFGASEPERSATRSLTDFAEEGSASPVTFSEEHNNWRKGSSGGKGDDDVVSRPHSGSCRSASRRPHSGSSSRPQSGTARRTTQRQDDDRAAPGCLTTTDATRRRRLARPVSAPARTVHFSPSTHALA